MKPKKKPRVRKPRDLKKLHVLYPHVEWNMGRKNIYAWMGGYGHTSAECRRLSAWLLKAADWLESKERG